jgi:hypothetical protein
LSNRGGRLAWIGVLIVGYLNHRERSQSQITLRCVHTTGQR